MSSSLSVLPIKICHPYPLYMGYLCNDCFYDLLSWSLLLCELFMVYSEAIFFMCLVFGVHWIWGTASLLSFSSNVLTWEPLFFQIFFSFFSFKGSNYTYMKFNEIVLQLFISSFLCFILVYYFCCLQIHLSFLLQCLIWQ